MYVTGISGKKVKALKEFVDKKDFVQNDKMQYMKCYNTKLYDVVHFKQYSYKTFYGCFVVTQYLGKFRWGSDEYKFGQKLCPVNSSVYLL